MAVHRLVKLQTIASSAGGIEEWFRNLDPTATEWISMGTAVIALCAAGIALSQAASARRQARAAERAAAAAEAQAAAAQVQTAAAEAQLSLTERQLVAQEEVHHRTAEPKFGLEWDAQDEPEWDNCMGFIITYAEGPGELDQIGVNVRAGQELDHLLLPPTNIAVSTLHWNGIFPGERLRFQAHLCPGEGAAVVDLVSVKGERKWISSARTWVY